MLDKHIETLITAGEEVDMVHYNSKFKGQIDWEEQLRIKRNARARARNILVKYTYQEVDEVCATNERLAYAMQFL